MLLKLVLASLPYLALSFSTKAPRAWQVMCYYDIQGSFRTGEASFHPKYLAEAAQYCTHLVYGYAVINKHSYTLESANPGFDIHQYKTFQEVLSLKSTFPHLRVLLSVGGGRDIEHPEKYLTLLEYPEKRNAFISSATQFAKHHGFDGLDLAWQFPPSKPKAISTGFWSSAWNTIKSPFVGGAVDPKAYEHGQQFADLISDLKKSCKNDGLTLSLSVLPNVNSTMYFDVPKIIPNLDIVNLWAFDYYTPERNPKEADLPAPLYQQVGRISDENAEHVVEYWCQNGAPAYKIFLGIPTYARTWKVTNPSASCLPPVLDVYGPGAPGLHTKEPGLLSFAELYPKLTESMSTLGVSTTVKEGFSSHKFAVYALLASDGSKQRDLWIGYEDPDTVEYKATYARKKGLGGVSMIDLSLDDFKGHCTGVKYPLLRAVQPGGSDKKNGGASFVPPTVMPDTIRNF